MRKVIGILSLVALVGAALVAAPTAAASFQGPNGKIVFSRSGEKPGIYVLGKDGFGLERLVRGSASNPVWSPDGTRIAFVRWRTDGTTRVQVMDADGTDRHAVGTPSLGMAEGCALQRPTWSYDSLFLLYRDDCFDAEPRVAQLRVATADGSAALDLTDYSSLNIHGIQSWSPNLEESSQVVFTSDREGDHDLYVMNSDGTDVIPLVDDDADKFAAAWSPDGSAIVFSAQVIEQGDPVNSLWLVAPQGGEPTLLVEGTPHATDPLWSPDGTMILFSRRDFYGVPTAVVVDPAGTQEVEIGAGFDAVDAAWAPASNAIVFSKNGNLVRYGLATGARKKLTSGEAWDSGPDWQPKPAQ